MTQQLKNSAGSAGLQEAKLLFRSEWLQFQMSGPVEALVMMD